MDELRSLFLFEKLTDDQLTWLCERGAVEHWEPGMVFREGDPATCFFVLLDGEIALLRRVGSDDIETTRTTQRGVYSGAWQAYLGDRVAQNYPGSMRAIQPSRFYVLAADDFSTAMRDWFPMAVHLLEGLFYGNQNSQRTIAQRERLLALGSLSAGLTHELNNPAAAAVRATSSLRERVAGMRHKLAVIAGGAWDRSQLETLIQLQERAVEHVAKAPELSAARGVRPRGRAHRLVRRRTTCPTATSWRRPSSQAGMDVEWLDKIAEHVDDGMLEGAVRWLNYTLETELLMNEIEDSTTRISTLVAAAKQYSQMDRAPYQVLDVHELLDSTLVMLSRKIGDDVKVVKEYDRTLPDVPVYGAELNQVWTNLIDNALQAMDGHGTLTIRTSRVRRRDPGRDRRHRAGRAEGHPVADLRAVLHHQAGRRGHRARPGHLLAHRRQQAPRRHRGGLAPGQTWFKVRLPLSSRSPSQRA